MIIDTHSHCYWSGLDERIDDIVANMKLKNVTKSIQIGCDIETSLKSVFLSQKFPEIFYSSVGFHPCEAKNINSWRKFFSFELSNFNNFDDFLIFLNSQSIDFWDDIFAKIPEFIELEKIIKKYFQNIVAIGETGLDFHYLDGTDDGQKILDKNNLTQKAIIEVENQKFFGLAQHKISQKYKLPLIIHSRDCDEETFDFIKNFGIKKAVLHCFSSNLDFAKKFLQISDEIVFGFGGTLTYKKNLNLQEVAKFLPLEKIILETDSPFLSPVPMRGKINEPANTRYVFDFLSELRSEKNIFLEEEIYKNSLKFFNIK